MSVFYTKAQSDAQAAKIGAAIKNVRTAIPTVGTAASKNIGTASGQIPLAQDLTKALYTPLQTKGVLINASDPLSDKLEGDVYYISDKPTEAPNGGSYGVFWTELAHASARRTQVFKHVLNVRGHYVRQETQRNSQTYGDWVKYAFHGEDYSATSVKAGAASYKRGWRKLTGTFGTGASTITKAHGVANVAGLTVKATVSGVSYYANDARVTHQFTVQTDGTNVIITKSADATAIDNAALTIYIDEEL